MSSLYRPTVSPAPVASGVAAPAATAAQKVASRRWFAKLGRVLASLVAAILAAVAVAYTLQDAEQVSSVGAVPTYNALVQGWTSSGLRELTQIASGVVVNVSLATVVYTSSGAPVAIAANSSNLVLTTGITSPDAPAVVAAAGASPPPASSMKRLQTELALRPGGTIPWRSGESRIEGRLILTVTNSSTGAVAAAEIDLPLAFIGTFPSSCFNANGVLRDCDCPLGDPDGMGRCRGVFALSGICLAARLAGGPSQAGDMPLAQLSGSGAAAGVNLVLSPPQGVLSLVGSGSAAALGPGCAPLPRLPHTPQSVLPPQIDGRVVTAGGGLAVGSYSFYAGSPPAGVPLPSIPVALRAAGDAWPFAMAATGGTGVFGPGSTRFKAGMAACWVLAAAFAVAALAMDAWLTRAECSRKQASATDAALHQTVPLRRDGRLETPTPAETAAAGLAASQAMQHWRRRCVTRRAVVIAVMVSSAAGIILGALALSGAAPQVCASRTIATGATVPLPCAYLHDFLVGSGPLAGPGAAVARLQIAAMALSLAWLVWLAAPAVVIGAQYVGTCWPRAEAFGDRAWRWLSTAAGPAFFRTVLAAQAVGACLWIVALLLWMGRADAIEDSWCTFLSSPQLDLLPSACWSAFGLRGYLVLAALFNAAAAMAHLAARSQVRCEGGLCALRCRSLARSTSRGAGGSGSPRHTLLIDSDDEDDGGDAQAAGAAGGQPSRRGRSANGGPGASDISDAPRPKRGIAAIASSASSVGSGGGMSSGDGGSAGGKRVRYERVSSTEAGGNRDSSSGLSHRDHRGGLGGRAALSDPAAGAGSTGSDDSHSAGIGASDAAAGSASGVRGSSGGGAVRWPPSAAEHLRAREEYSQSVRQRRQGSGGGSSNGGGRLPSGAGAGAAAGAGALPTGESAGSAIGINSGRDTAGPGFLPPAMAAEPTSGSGAGPLPIVYPSARSIRDIPMAEAAAAANNGGPLQFGQGSGSGSSGGGGGAGAGLSIRAPSSRALGGHGQGQGQGLPPRHRDATAGASAGAGPQAGGGGGLSLRSASSRAVTDASAAGTAGYAPDSESIVSGRGRGREHPGAQRELTNASSTLPGGMSPGAVAEQPAAASDDALSARSGRSAGGELLGAASDSAGGGADGGGSAGGQHVRSAWGSPS